MEEYRDLDLTVTALQEVLDEEEFLPLPAGIVLQAYLPDSHRVQRELTDWALERGARGGAPVKLRIVKGANLAMERIEGELHGWPQAPYATKPEVDANYERMLEYGCRPDHARAVHLGIATHNLFDVAYGLLLREDEGVEAVGRVRDARGHGQSSGAGGAGASGRRSCSTRRWCGPRTSQAPSPISCAGSTRTPPRTTFSGTCSTSSRTRRPGRASATGSSPRSTSSTRVGCARGARRTARPSRARRIRRQPTRRRHSTNEPDTDWSIAANRALDRPA